LHAPFSTFRFEWQQAAAEEIFYPIQFAAAVHTLPVCCKWQEKSSILGPWDQHA